jgi:hypothetical protein
MEKGFCSHSTRRLQVQPTLVYHDKNGCEAEQDRDDKKQIHELAPCVSRVLRTWLTSP